MFCNSVALYLIVSFFTLISCSDDEIGPPHKSNLRTTDKGPLNSEEASSETSGAKNGQTTIFQGDADPAKQDDAGLEPSPSDEEVIVTSQQMESLPPPEPDIQEEGSDDQETGPVAGSPVDLIRLTWKSPGVDADVVSYQIFAKEDLPYLAETGIPVAEVLVSANSFNLEAPAYTLGVAENPGLKELKGKKVCFQVVAYNTYGRSLASDEICLDTL